jgi:AcrR family transcriptional regulator
VRNHTEYDFSVREPDDGAPGTSAGGPHGRRPRQRRAEETRRRIYEAALSEYERVGIEAARVEDIIVAAGVSWSTFFDYFPRKEDVLQEAGAGRAAAFARAIEDGLTDRDRSIPEVLKGALHAARNAAPSSPAVQAALMRDIVNHPGRMTACLADRGIPPWMESATRLLAEGQRRGEIRADYPARAMAVVLMQAWAMSANRENALGRPPGEWNGPASSLAGLAIEICLTGMRPPHTDG